MSLSSEMENHPDESELAVFRTFISRMMSLQHQFHTEYHSDRQLRDRLLNDVEIPAIKDGIKERILRTSHQGINRVDNSLSTSKRTEGSISALIADCPINPDDDDEEEGDGVYDLGQRMEETPRDT